MLNYIKGMHNQQNLGNLTTCFLHKLIAGETRDGGTLM